MSAEFEIERKFLVEFPNLAGLNIRRTCAIVQTYLGAWDSSLQRRVRRITDNGCDSYFYTEKRFITAVTREENESEITREQYEKLLGEARGDSPPVNKVRYWFEYENQLFELDTYPFSDKLAILELELDSDEQEIFFPDSITVLKEVTGDSRYSNARLAEMGAFPE